MGDYSRNGFESGSSGPPSSGAGLPSYLEDENACPSMNGPPSNNLCDKLFPFNGWWKFTTITTFIDVIMFIATLWYGAANLDGAFVASNSMGGPSTRTLVHVGGKWEPYIRDEGQVYRLITPVVLHAGLIHLLSNVFFFLRMGWLLEARWGWWRTMAIYIISGIGGVFLSCICAPGVVSVGASGALFGLVGANVSWLIFNWDAVPLANYEAVSLAFVILINFLFGIGGNNGIDNFAHLGGCIVGLLVGTWLAWDYVDKGACGSYTKWTMFILYILYQLLLIGLLFIANPGGPDNIKW